MTRRDGSTWTPSKITSCCRRRGPPRACPCSLRGPSAPVTHRITSSRWVAAAPRPGWVSTLARGQHTERTPGGPQRQRGEDRQSGDLLCHQPLVLRTCSCCPRRRVSRGSAPQPLSGGRRELAPGDVSPSSAPPGGTLERARETWFPTRPCCQRAPRLGAEPSLLWDSVYLSVGCRGACRTSKVRPAPSGVLSHTDPTPQAAPRPRVRERPPALALGTDPSTLYHTLTSSSWVTCTTRL